MKAYFSILTPESSSPPFKSQHGQIKHFCGPQQDCGPLVYKTLLTAAIMSSFSSNPKPNHLSKSLPHTHHTSLWPVLTHTDIQTHTHMHSAYGWENAIIPFLSGDNLHPSQMGSDSTNSSKLFPCLPNSFSLASKMRQRKVSTAHVIGFHHLGASSWMKIINNF